MFEDVDGVRLSARTIALGELEIASGAIALGDPFIHVYRVQPPSGPLAAGAYPVELALVRFEADGACVKGDERVACARVRISDAPAVSWVRAEHVAEVDTGTCTFLDAGAEDFAIAEAESDQLLAALERDTHGPSVSATRQRFRDRELFVFSSGLGDGIYPAFWGLDAGGQPTALSFDFGLLITAVVEDVALGWPIARGAVRDPRLAQHGVKARVPWLGARRLVFSSRGAFARWRLSDGSWRRPRVEWKDGRLSLLLSERPEQAELVLRITVAERACARIS